MKKAKRSFVSLLTALSFVVMAVTGIIAFFTPFSIKVVGLHSLMGFVFVLVIALHVTNNARLLSRHLRSRSLSVTVALSLGLTALFLWQPPAIQRFLGLSKNLGPARERFEMFEEEMVFQYVPSDSYRMMLSIRTGAAYDFAAPPQVAIWLENQGTYHIKTLLLPEEGAASHLPYWSFKRQGWEQARREAEENTGADIISSETPNGSFDPRDYILPSDPDNPMPYRLLIEINQPGDDQPSLVYGVEIDNADPRAYQLLDIVGYPRKEIDEETGKEEWPLYYVDDQFDSALDLIDSALLTIDRMW
jgi:hypothetical protein